MGLLNNPSTIFAARSLMLSVAAATALQLSDCDRHILFALALTEPIPAGWSCESLWFG